MPGPNNLIIVDTDIALFDPSSFMPAIPVPPIVMAPIKAKGKAQAHKLNITIMGDEKSVKAPASYITASHPIPGSGTFKIISLSPDQLTKKTTHNNKSIIVRGSQFVAALQVQGPAQMPTPAGPVPSPTPIHPGKGLFPFPKNVTVFAV